jgi:hypothetical protein
MLSGMGRGKIDPWLFLRPIWRWAGKIPGRILRNISKILRDWSKTTWRQASRASLPGKCALWILSGLLGLGSLLLAIPADILGAATKK